MKGAISLTGVRKVYRRSRNLGRFHTLKGALFHRQLHRQPATESFVALAGVDLEISPGEAVALIGPNGSGKSTTLKLISGILQPTAGSVTTDGRVTALIELGAGFHPEISGRENVIINAMLLGLSRKEILQRLDSIIEFAGVGDFIDQPVKTYSSGMYVRLGFAVAVAVDPAILLIDEVLAVGDAAFSQRSLDRLARMREQGVTMVLVSHDLELVKRFADRAVYLSGGEVIGEGSPESVIATYRGDLVGRGTRLAEPKPESETAAPSDGKRWGNGVVKIERVETCSGGKTRKMIPTGAECTVRIVYRVQEPVDDFVFGLAWSTADGDLVAGHNTELDGWQPRRLAEDGEVCCAYGSLQLAPGEYLLDAAVHAKDGTAYDYWCGAASLQVTAPVVWPGIWAPDHSWQGDGPDWQAPATENESS
jgi:ABC-type polysaccharide/polyol phosphate transport system ATPase subunit